MRPETVIACFSGIEQIDGNRRVPVFGQSREVHPRHFPDTLYKKLPGPVAFAIFRYRVHLICVITAVMIGGDIFRHDGRVGQFSQRLRVEIVPNRSRIPIRIRVVGLVDEVAHLSLRERGRRLIRKFRKDAEPNCFCSRHRRRRSEARVRSARKTRCPTFRHHRAISFGSVSLIVGFDQGFRR